MNKAQLYMEKIMHWYDLMILNEVVYIFSVDNYHSNQLLFEYISGAINWLARGQEPR